MKRGIILFILVGISLSVLASAEPEILFQHNETQPGETILGTILVPGELVENIEKSDITFLEGRKEVFFEHDIVYFNETYYFYAYATREGNFSIKIENILYRQEGELKSDILRRNFIVEKKTYSEGNFSWTEILSIKPGFIEYNEEPILTLSNKGNTSINITCSDSIISLDPLDSKEINIEQNDTLDFFECESYKIFLIPVMRPAINDSIEPPLVIEDLKTDPELIELNITIGEPIEKKIQLFNFGDENFTDIELISDLGFVEIEQIQNLTGKGIANLTLKISAELPGHYTGKINISYKQNNESKVVPIALDFFILPQGTNSTGFQISNLSCAELGGNICISGTEKCNGTAQFTDIGEYCCPSNCFEVKTDEGGSGGGLGWIIGLLILAGLAGGAYYLYNRQKKMAPPKPEDQLKETSKKIDERLKGSPRAKRVSGSLERH